MSGLVCWRGGLWSLISSLLISILLATSANAHLVNTGLGPFYDGVSHLLLSPEDVITVIAMALLAGLNGPNCWSTHLICNHRRLACCGCCRIARRQSAAARRHDDRFILIAGDPDRTDRRLSPAAVATLAAAIGVLHGWLNGAGTAGAKPATIGVLLGVSSAIFVLVAVVAATPVATRWVWARVGFRVTGSWIAAIGLLMLGWEMRKM